MYSMSSDRVDQETRRYDQLQDMLIAEFPNLDDQTLADTLEGITDLRALLAELVRSALEDEALLEAQNTRLADLKARQRRIARRADAKRALVLKAMKGAKIKSLNEPDFSAFVRKAAPCLELVSEETIPTEFWKPQPAKLDRHGLLEALKAGAAVQGAKLKEGEAQLSVRTR